MPAGDHFELPRGFSLLRDLHQLNLEAREMVRELSERDLAVGNFLGNMNQRMELLAGAMIDVDAHEVPPAGAELSEGGLNFMAPDLLAPDTLIALKMLFVPSCLGLTCHAVVRHARLDENSRDYRIGTQFLDMAPGDETLIARHILRRQADERRERLRRERFE